MTQFSRLAIAAALFLPGMAEAADNGWRGVNPALSAAEIIERHGDNESYIRLTFEVNRQTGEDQVSSDNLVIEVGSDFVSLDEGDGPIIYDLAHDRLIQSDLEAKTFTSLSFYPIIEFRYFEIKNRAMMRQMFQGLGGLATESAVEISPMLQRFWAESELGVTSPKDPPEIEYRGDGQSFEAHFEGSEVLRVKFGTDRVKNLQLDNFWRLFRWRLGIHPNIVDRLAADGRLPQELSWQSAAGLNGLERKTIILLQIEERKGGIPLNPAFVPTPGDIFRMKEKERELLTATFEFAKNLSSAVRFDFAAEVDASNKALEGPNPLDGLLGLLMAYTQATGFCSNSKAKARVKKSCTKALTGVRAGLQLPSAALFLNATAISTIVPALVLV